MELTFVQLQSLPPAGSIDPFIGWVVAAVFSTMTTALGIMWRQSVAESKRKDDLIDKLLQAGFDNADANKRSVSLLEQERRRSPL